MFSLYQRVVVLNYDHPKHDFTSSPIIVEVTNREIGSLVDVYQNSRNEEREE